MNTMKSDKGEIDIDFEQNQGVDNRRFFEFCKNYRIVLQYIIEEDVGANSRQIIKVDLI
jgi:hypothetical protein